ncbi:uncharacterized protein ACLA_026810 [Aspergillus clavatus NRRL 1]|uniref:Maltose/galactoside acetyltransferase domain-containing protein n=1 Tax=Aspergillus clavatus (strain ATCC 1007 / CBS 513.65 / DSM 816 / NCTC 3887 / NRRL 1 / QM 1276 / 107) TaxID=344612 RepID=A1CQN8_ASPCL|nr:uncharacterized protein ACLA_026810 [Aspergillus clavatus NRRL 1]EAW07959.1 hypothetical protein ACLA_026810 [Aspergillus clavatus NRRL 1]
MSTIPANSRMNGHETERMSKPENQSPSRFTAVNGKDTTMSGIADSSTADLSNAEEQGDSFEIQGRIEVEAAPRPDERVRDGGIMGSDQDEQASHQSLNYQAPSLAIQKANKRKRSESGERQSVSMAVSKGPRSPVGYTDEASDSHSHSNVLHPPGSPHNDHEARNAPPSVVRSDRHEGSRPSSLNTPINDYDSHLVQQAQRAQQIDASDAQLAEVLQRESQTHDAPGTVHKSWGTANRLAEESTQSEEPSAMSTFAQERPQAAVQVAPKRKRVFSNRTKTGCNNCIRGGFLCEGYSSRSTWQKPSSAKTPVPLQSKEGYSDVGGQYVHDLSQPHERQQVLTEQIDSGKMRAIISDESDRNAGPFSASPTGISSTRGSWSKRNWPNAGHTAFIPDHMSKPDYREVPSIHELSCDGHPKSDYQIVPSIRDMPHGSHQKPGVSLYQSGLDQRPAHTGSVDASSPQAQARMALSIEHQLSSRTVPGDESEKDKMIRGELYRPFDIHLVEERERCKAALWRFNNACNPLSGLTTKEQNRLLKEVLVPSGSIVGSPSSMSAPRPAGSIGQGAVVESPFQCHYGFNIHIGEDVMISEHCLFVDDCSITVGAHTWIGPRVTILSSMAHANMQERKGSQSRYQGRPVTIEEDCYVGAGCTIYPGVRLRRGAYVAPGEVVKSDIVAYGFQGLKPSYM